jgi:hypothetical protein
MSVVIISYPPGAGGNHLKNILCLDSSFVNSGDLDLSVYDAPVQPPGTVHSRPGRNVHEYIINDIVANPDQRWILHGHFGELAPYQDSINGIKEKIFVLISLNNARDQQLLTSRQQRLGYGHHPYWNQEEQPYLYQPRMYTDWFTGDRIVDISIYDFWNPNYIATGFIDWLNSVLDTAVDAESAQNLHTKWWQQNFFFDFCNYTRSVYNTV